MDKRKNSIKTLVLVLVALISDFTRIHNVPIIIGETIKIIFIFNHLIDLRYITQNLQQQ